MAIYNMELPFNTYMRHKLPVQRDCSSMKCYVLSTTTFGLVMLAILELATVMLATIKYL